MNGQKTKPDERPPKGFVLIHTVPHYLGKILEKELILWVAPTSLFIPFSWLHELLHFLTFKLTRKKKHTITKYEEVLSDDMTLQQLEKITMITYLANEHFSFFSKNNWILCNNLSIQLFLQSEEMICWIRRDNGTWNHSSGKHNDIWLNSRAANTAEYDIID